MNIFLSFSGTRSRDIACKFDTFIQDVIEIASFISEERIKIGTPWAGAISDALEKADVGVLFLLPENVQSPWMFYEAGAIAKSSGSRLVIFTFEYAVPKGPLAGRQSAILPVHGSNFSKDSVLRFIEQLTEKWPHNRCLAVRRNFDAHWEKLERDIAVALSRSAPCLVEGIHHVSLIVDDLDISEEFYGQLLGLRKIERDTHFNSKGTWFDVGNGHHLHLILRDPALHDSSASRSSMSRIHDRPHFALRVADYGVALNILNTAKVYKDNPEKISEPQPERTASFFTVLRS